MPQRVCILTGGGDAPGLNACVRAFVHAASRRNILVHASRFGFEGLLGREPIEPLRMEDVRGILPRGGSVLGCSTQSNPFSLPPGDPAVHEATATIRARIGDLGIGALVLAGGDGTMSIAERITELGIPCVGIPKTIDGDLGGTELTCGLDTAVATATHAVDALHSTAEAHQRVMIVEVMGRYAGWIALKSGIAGGADVILVPEIPYDVERVVAKVRERASYGLRFTIVVVGEGAHPFGGAVSEVESAHAGRLQRLGGAAERLAKALAERRIGHEVRVTVLGHLQRGGTPTPADRLLATRFGVHAAQLCAEGRYGRMVCLRGGRVDSIPIIEACRAPSRVDPGAELVQCAREMGIEMGA